MNKKAIGTLLLSTAAALSSYADWTVISTFDDASALSVVTDVTNIEGSNARSEVVDGKLAVYPGDLFESTSNLYAMIDLGTDLRAASQALNGPVTIYLEVGQPTVNGHKAIVDTVWGPSNATPESVLAGDPNRFNAYTAMSRINSGNDAFEVLNKVEGSNVYQTIDLFSADTMYSIWMVVDYSLDFWECYIQGGQWTEQTRLDTDDMTGIWLFRTNPAPEGTVQWFQVSLSRGNSSPTGGEKGIDPTYFDNVAIDTTGQNLTKPPVGDGPTTWAGYTVDSNGNANTMGWLGIVNVTHKPWIYSWSMGAYLYIEEDSITDGGSWVYVSK